MRAISGCLQRLSGPEPPWPPPRRAPSPRLRAASSGSDSAPETGATGFPSAGRCPADRDMRSDSPRLSSCNCRARTTPPPPARWPHRRPASCRNQLPESPPPRPRAPPAPSPNGHVVSAERTAPARPACRPAAAPRPAQAKSAKTQRPRFCRPMCPDARARSAPFQSASAARPAPKPAPRPRKTD